MAQPRNIIQPEWSFIFFYPEGRWNCALFNECPTLFAHRLLMCVQSPVEVRPVPRFPSLHRGVSRLGEDLLALRLGEGRTPTLEGERQTAAIFAIEIFVLYVPLFEPRFHLGPLVRPMTIARIVELSSERRLDRIVCRLAAPFPR